MHYIVVKCINICKSIGLICAIHLQNNRALNIKYMYERVQYKHKYNLKWRDYFVLAMHGKYVAHFPSLAVKTIRCQINNVLNISVFLTLF